MLAFSDFLKGFKKCKLVKGPGPRKGAEIVFRAFVSTKGWPVMDDTVFLT
jgi:hypothetical protein